MLAVRSLIVEGQNVGKNDRQRAAASAPGRWLLTLQRSSAGLNVNTTAVAVAAVQRRRLGRSSASLRAGLVRSRWVRTSTEVLDGRRRLLSQ
jgi:hypothetical protein